MSTENGKSIENWQWQEIVDDAIISGRQTDLFVEFKAGSKIVVDLTVAGYNHIAIEKNLTTLEIHRNEITDGVMYEVCVAQREEDIDKDLWIRKYGVSHAPYLIGEKFDTFCFQKALSKATRNAIKQFISVSDKNKMITALKSSTNTQSRIPKEDQPKPPSEIQKDAIKLFRQHEEHLSALGINRETFWNGVKLHYRVESRDKMSDTQWDDLYESLAYVEPDEHATPYADWIHSLGVSF